MSQFWVDPENLSRSGQGYADVGDRLESIRQRVSSFGARYRGSFGDDDVGAEFFGNFDEGNETFVEGVTQLSGSLRYISEGLHENGKMYAGSRDAADELSGKFKSLGGDVPLPPGKPASYHARKPSETPQNDVMPRRPNRHSRSQAPDKPGRESKSTAQRSVTHVVGDREPEGVVTRDAQMISAMSMRAVREGEQPRVDGVPLRKNQGIVSATELEGGVVRLKVDGYSDITALDGHDLTLNGRDGRSKPYPAEEGERLFLVTEDPGAENSRKPGDQIYMEFPRDGEPSYFRQPSG
ncbi:hypothetical protein [Saccharopolyspora sp. NPDC002376]